MIQKNSLLLMIYTISLTLSLFPNEVRAEKWIYFGQNEIGTTFFYDKENLNKSDQTISVKVKTHIEPDMKKYTDCLMNEQQTRKCGYFSHSITKYEIKCLDGLFRRVETKDYNSEGMVTHSDEIKYEYQSIPKDSVIDELKIIVCK